jgi:predicted NUDIX family NTP pyrophosphohydrolase
MTRKKESAGILLYRMHNNHLEVFLVHPGGPFFKNRDKGAWSIPKGEPGGGEDARAAAVRELREETGIDAEGPYICLDSITQKGGKTVSAWACEYHGSGPPDIQSNTCTITWPPRSGRKITIPEIDRGEFYDMQTAQDKINPAQRPLLERLEAQLPQKK